jgi:hypothetical protein
MGEGYDVYVVTDASGGVSPEAHDSATDYVAWHGRRTASVIRHAQRGAQKSLRSCSTMRALPAPYGRGSWETKAKRA